MANRQRPIGFGIDHVKLRQLLLIEPNLLVPHQTQTNRPRFSPLAAWIVFSVFCSCVGWTLSVLKQLNFGGYAISFGFALIALLIWKSKTGAILFSKRDTVKIQHRFHRWLPRAFLVLASLAVLGGIIYPPTNYDALAYRVPRVLHWLAAEHWHWIHTAFPRMNTRGCGIEWISAPLIVFTKSDRLLFLINVASFLLLPGLFFSVFTKLGVRARVAWSWMWIAPTGYCYLLQAASIGNDLFGAVFPLAALHFALRARRSKNYRDLLLSILAAAMIGSGKASNLPLTLPWFIAFVPSVPILLPKWKQTIAVGIAAALASFLPTAFLNSHYCHDWSGSVLEGEKIFVGRDTLLRIVWNPLPLAVENLTPPIFPLANAWNAMVVNHIPKGLEEHLLRAFEAEQAQLHVVEMQIEEDAGLGFGISVLLLLGLLVGIFRRSASPSPIKTRSDPLQVWILTGIGIALFTYLFSMGMGIARLITPYYAMVLPFFLRAQYQTALVGTRWWRLSIGVIFALAGAILIASPPRTLWPAQTVLQKLDGKRSSRWIQRARTVYDVYRERARGFQPAIAVLPPEIGTLGIVTFDDPEATLWKPFGSRQIEHVVSGDTGDDLRKRGLQYILVSSEKFALTFNETFGAWLVRVDGEIVRVIPLQLRAAKGPVEWYLVKLRSNAEKN